MKLQAFALAGLTGAVMVGVPAQADFTGVSFATHIPQAGGQTTYRYFAHFDDPTDQILAVSGTEAQILRFQTNTMLLNNGGAFAGTKAEDFAQFPISGADDSWVTIGASAFAGNDTDYSPTFLNNDGLSAVVVGSSWSDTNDGWFDSNPGTVTSGTTILIAQFTVADDGTGAAGLVSLEGNVDYSDLDVPGTPVSGSFAAEGNLPAPGALALLGLAGVAGRRRRRG